MNSSLKMHPEQNYHFCAPKQTRKAWTYVVLKSNQKKSSLRPTSILVVLDFETFEHSPPKLKVQKANRVTPGKPETLSIDSTSYFPDGLYMISCKLSKTPIFA